jgi:hypothetical protein
MASEIEALFSACERVLEGVDRRSDMTIDGPALSALSEALTAARTAQVEDREAIAAIIDEDAWGMEWTFDGAGKLKDHGFWPLRRELSLAKADAILSLRGGAGVVAPEVEALLKDPVAVHLNMLRGGIAKLTPAQIGHLYSGDEAEAIIAELQRQNGFSASPASRPEGRMG